MSFILELWAFVLARKRLWLVPILMTMLLVGILLVLAQSSAVAPLIYTIF